MTEPVLIIHGVANHTPEPFLESVAALQRQLDDLQGDAKWKLIPVFWGDLGGKSQDIGDCLPVLRDGQWTVRAGEAALPTPIRDDLGSGRLTNAERAAIIVNAPPETNVRAAEATASPALVYSVTEALDETRILQYIDDPDVLGSMHEAIMAASDDAEASPADADAPLFTTRSGLSDRVRRVVESIDNMLGKVIGNSLGTFNQRLRGAVAHPFSLFFGDIFVYQAGKDKLQQRIWDEINAHAPGYGTAGRPIHAIGHSLGGLLLFDAAVRPKDDPKRLYLKSLTTFGSQPAFFHILDQRPELAAYRRGQKVRLPETIGRWTNLWDAMDLLAFTASTVFELHNGTNPVDIPIQDPLSQIITEKGWMHSVYWKTEALVEAIHRNLSA